MFDIFNTPGSADLFQRLTGQPLQPWGGANGAAGAQQWLAQMRARFPGQWGGGNWQMPPMTRGWGNELHGYAPQMGAPAMHQTLPMNPNYGQGVPMLDRRTLPVNPQAQPGQIPMMQRRTLPVFPQG